MGAQVAKSNTPDDNEVKANTDAVFQGLQSAADNFLSGCRLANSSAEVLGYPLTDKRLTSQECRLVVQTKENAQEGDVAKGIHDVFGGNWEAVATNVATNIFSYLGGKAPNPHQSAVNDSFAKSFLVFEDNNIVQYGVYIKRTNCKSVSHLLGDSHSTMMTVLCKGNVDYAHIDPQTVISCYMESPQFNSKVSMEKAFDEIGKELKLAAKLLVTKRDVKEYEVDGRDHAKPDKPQHAIDNGAEDDSDM